MANVNAPFGFKPVRYLNGAPWNGQARYYNVNSGKYTQLHVAERAEPVRLSRGA